MEKFPISVKGHVQLEKEIKYLKSVERPAIIEAIATAREFGDLSENYELAAMKSAGISLRRTLQPLFYLITIFSIAAFIFANSVIPYAEYKFINFRKNIAQSKPALAIAEGQFSDVGIYNIKVNKKSGENGENLSGITIHKKSDVGDGSRIIIKAKNGKLVSSEGSNTLQMILNDGNYYEDILPKKTPLYIVKWLVFLKNIKLNSQYKI